MKEFCPVCGSPIQYVRQGVRMPPTKMLIFDAIKRAGADGISTEDIMRIVYGDRDVEPHTIKTHIYQINELLVETNVIIRSLGRVYALCRRKRQEE